MEDKFLVYENWRAERKAVVHKAICGHAKEGQEKIDAKWLINNSAPNDRWFGYFSTVNEAVAFASLLPNRKLHICSVCLKEFKNKKDE